MGGLLPAAAMGDVVISNLDKNIAFTIDDGVFTYRGYQQFHSLALQQQSKRRGSAPVLDPTTGGDSLLKGLIENHLLSLSAREGSGSESESDSDHAGHLAEHSAEHADEHADGHSNDDGHGHEIALYVDTYDEYRDLLALLLKKKPSLVFEQVIVVNKASDNLSKSLEKLLKSGQAAERSAKKNRIISQESFSKHQEEQAKELVVGQYQLPKQDISSVSYWDVYRIQSVQNKAKVRRGDLASIQKGVEEWVGMKLLEHELKETASFTDSDLHTLWQFVWDKQYKQQYYLETGIVMDLHHDQPRLEVFKRRVTEEEIARYYQEHQSEFVQVGSVVARHITVATQEKADQVYAELNKGLDFNEAVKRYSLSKDGGQLGFINKNDKKLSFVKKLALIQAVGKVSTPYRMLDGKSYEILLIDKKQPEPLPLTDKSVQNQIANTLAVTKAKLDLESSLARWSKKHDITLNSRYFKGAPL